MKGKISLTAFLFVAVMAMLISALFSFNPVVTFGVMFVGSMLAPTPNGAAMMAVTREIWCKDIVDNLYKNNEFALRAFSADTYVLLGKVVHIAVAGAPSVVKKNVTEFPQTAVKRTDSEITYAIDTFYSLPRQIERIEQYELEYDKRQSVLGEDQAALIQTSMDSLLFRWAPLKANCILTAGAAVAATLAGATGNRKGCTKAAIAAIKLKMDRANIPAQGRVAVLTADMYNQFLESLGDAERTDFGRVADLANGIVGRYLGFDFLMRSSVLRYRGADLANLVVVDEQADDYAATVDDRAASLVYHQSCVERARGSVEFFDGSNRPEYYGDIYSMLLRLGGRIRRAAGVWAVVEDLSA
jgi:hypothetical protein